MRKENPKLEIPNPKQISTKKAEMTETGARLRYRVSRLYISSFPFVSCLGFGV
jgi:hypothetical protein